MDTANDTTPLTASSINSSGQFVPGVPVTIPVGGTLTFEVTSPSRVSTLVYDQSSNSLVFVANVTESTAGRVALPNFSDMALFSPDSNTVYAPVRNAPVTGARPGVVEAITVSSLTITATYNVPSARYVALSPNGQFLLVEREAYRRLGGGKLAAAGNSSASGEQDYEERNPVPRRGAGQEQWIILRAGRE